MKSIDQVSLLLSGTVSKIMWLGVRHWPFVPALDICASAGDLAQHVFINVALGVAFIRRNHVEHLHNLGQQAQVRKAQPRVHHIGAVPLPGLTESLVLSPTREGIG